MFVPPIALAIRYRLYVEALFYFFNMFFSTVRIAIRFRLLRNLLV